MNFEWNRNSSINNRLTVEVEDFNACGGMSYKRVTVEVEDFNTCGGYVLQARYCGNRRFLCLRGVFPILCVMMKVGDSHHLG